MGNQARCELRGAGEHWRVTRVDLVELDVQPLARDATPAAAIGKRSQPDATVKRV